MRWYNVYEMSRTSTPTRPARGLVVPGIDTHSVFDQKPCLSQQTQLFSGWGPQTPPSSAQESRRPSLAFSSRSDATNHSGTSSLSAFSQPATPVHSMANSTDSFVHQWHETAQMHAGLPAQMESACNLSQSQAMYDMSSPNGLPDISMHMPDASPMRTEMWQEPQHASFGPALQPGLADTLYHSAQNLGHPHAQHASMYANPSASMTASMNQSVFPDCDSHVPAVPAFHSQPRVVVPSQLGHQEDYPMDHYPQYDQNESMSRDFAQSFDSNMTGPSGWESVGPPSPMAAYVDPCEEDYVMVKDEFIKDEFAATPSKSRAFDHIPLSGPAGASRVHRRPPRKARTSRASGNVFYEKDTGSYHLSCTGKPFFWGHDHQGKRVVMPETPRVAKQHRCKFQKQNNTICNAGFHRAEHLKRHMTSHSNVRPFPCPLPNCKGRIGRSDNALDHFMTHLREKTKKKRNAHSTLEQIEQHLRGHPAWEDKKIDKMIEHLHRRLALEQQKARVAAAKKERELAMEDFHGKRLSRL